MKKTGWKNLGFDKSGNQIHDNHVLHGNVLKEMAVESGKSAAQESVLDQIPCQV